jgi:cell wall-associated NlpC family hydrolase
VTIRARLGGILVAAVVAACGAVVPATGAHASPGLTTARQKAAALRKAVDALELQAAKAVEDYDAASDALAVAVAARLRAQADLDRAKVSADAGADAFAQRVRTLYMTGGTMTLYASVLDATDLHDAFGRLANVNSVLRHEGVTVATADSTAADAALAAKRLRDVAYQQTRLERTVAAAAARVQGALAQQKALLAQATADVRRIADEDRRKAEAAAQAAFAARLEAAGVPLATLKNDTTAAPNAVAARAIAAARTQLGKPYQWGAVGPDTFDCSGLTGWAYRQAGLALPRTSRQQWSTGTHPSLSELAPGDLLFWGSTPGNPQSIHHVALYIGGGLMIAAPHTGANVKVQPVYLGDFFGVTRPALDTPGAVP